MALFKCKSSGNIFEFKYEHDIQSMRKHPEYEEVVSENKETVDEVVSVPSQFPTKRNSGRPRKVKE